MDHLKPRLANSPSLTPLSFLERAATAYAECTSIIYNKTTYTWAETYKRCLQIASSLQSYSIGRHCVVSVLAPNIPAAYELHFAVPMCGAVLNNINTRLDSRAISVLLSHSESTLVFVDYQYLTLIQHALSLLPSSYTKPKLILIEENIKNEKTPVTVTTYEEMINKGNPGFKWVRPESDWDPIVLNYTSGTTSSPKGVVHCHKSSFITTVTTLINWPLTKNSVHLWTLPMFHSNGWGYTWGMAAVGATNVCVRKFDAAMIYTTIQKYGVTHMCCAPVVLNMMANFTRQENIRKMHILTAGAPPPTEVLRKVEALGFVISHGYGMTETGGCFVSCEWKLHWDKASAEERAKLKARQGIKTIATAEVDIIDPGTGKSVVADGKCVGEIVVRGACLMLGYFKDPEATSKCMGEDGWFRTGDMGVMHPDGYLEIKDRYKDVIISGGENISSVEVESVLYTFPNVSEAAVVARPDEHWGETPCAFVSLKEGSTKVTEREVIEFCRERLPHYMVPKTVVFKDELPKTSIGKIQKFMLREMAKGFGALRASRL